MIATRVCGRVRGCRGLARVLHKLRRYPLEIKATATPTLGQVTSLQKWMKLSGTRNATVLCMVEEEKPLGEGIRALPWWDHPRIWS